MGGGIDAFPGRRRSIVAARQQAEAIYQKHVAQTVAVAFDKPPAPVVVMSPPEPERRKPGRPKKVRP